MRLRSTARRLPPERRSQRSRLADRVPDLVRGRGRSAIVCGFDASLCHCAPSWWSPRDQAKKICRETVASSGSSGALAGAARARAAKEKPTALAHLLDECRTRLEGERVVGVEEQRRPRLAIEGELVG